MSQITLLEKITADAQKHVAAIKKQADTEVAAIERETKNKIAALQGEAATVLAKKKQQTELVATSRAKQAGNIAMQNAKRTQIDSLFAQVFSELTSQSAEEYVAFFTTQAKALIPKDAVIEKVHAPVNRVKETHEILTALAIDAEVVTSPTVSAGLIAFAKDGVYDASFDRLFKEKRAELEMIIVREIVPKTE